MSSQTTGLSTMEVLVLRAKISDLKSEHARLQWLDLRLLNKVLGAFMPDFTDDDGLDDGWDDAEETE